MDNLKAELLRGLWYVACPGAEIKAGAMTGRKLMGELVLIGRDRHGKVFALRDICPHRGIPLRHGWFDGEHVQCCYHGWKFDTDGACVDIPSTHEYQTIDYSKITCGAYPAVEQQGLIWIYFAEKGEKPEDGRQPAPPLLPDFAADQGPSVAIMQPFVCSVDHAALGLMDPTHAAFVHTSWWFKKNGAKLRPKEKVFEPSELGWAMVRHKIPPQNIAYRYLLGDNVTTEISYRLPGLRIEHIKGDRHCVVGLTTITPVTEDETEVRQLFWSTIGWLKPFNPLVRYLMNVFLDQDRRVVIQQREGLEYNPKLMLINDADTQGRWWMQLKREWATSQAEGRAFDNPVKARTLRWMS
ncbi:aromatic ring-hydroxylating oxygenase subunit alpha [Polymorphum gilvum]|uniref:Ring-hydroxylating dioxygenase, large terminal subunit n=1 Tax=Polymorphum gilvum (strain LMG 25793 / CGMCC 1.9160 / SL003B-26A1) TaxID=991905 RepID=F2J3L5_POLGS|nr:aromatic ring-hydroxylating dioxygenase subunit alpha [Polymorphum gilvum]ADZ72151.1 Ring-hydroxylating dioxygenase, large terminal subunit [Polymorphum gilvum SL003B-26A1]